MVNDRECLYVLTKVTFFLQSIVFFDETLKVILFFSLKKRSVFKEECSLVDLIEFVEV